MNWQEFRDHVTKLMEGWHVPGVAVGIVKDGEVVFAEGFGYTDINTKQEVTADTQFSIGSSTKAFTTTALGLLVDEGVLSWDIPVRRFLPEFRMHDAVAADRVTLRDMACHRTGVPRYDAMLFNLVFRRGDILDRLQYLKPTKDFRTTWQYNNLMYAAMGSIIDRVTGTTWEKFVRERLLGALGMSNTSFDCHEIVHAPDHAWPHEAVEGKISRLEFMSIGATGPAGSINSSVKDMAKWIQFNLKGGNIGGHQFISAATIKDIQSPQIPMQGQQNDPELSHSSYCLGWMSGCYRGHHVVQHGGATVGFQTEVAFLPQNNIGVVVLSNNNSPIPQFIARRVFDTMLGLEPIDWSGKAKERRAKMEQAKVEDRELPKVQNTTPSHALEEYAGTYRHEGLGDITVALDNEGRLTVAYGNIDMTLTHRHFDVFDAKMPEFFRSFKMAVAFHNASDGTILSLSLPLGFDPLLEDLVFTRVPDSRMTDVSYLEQFLGQYEFAGQVIQVNLNKQGALTIEMPGQPVMTLVPHKDTTFNFKGLPGFSITFQKGEAKLTQPGGVFTLTKQ